MSWPRRRWEGTCRWEVTGVECFKVQAWSAVEMFLTQEVPWNLYLGVKKQRFIYFSFNRWLVIHLNRLNLIRLWWKGNKLFWVKYKSFLFFSPRTLESACLACQALSRFGGRARTVVGMNRERRVLPAQSGTWWLRTNNRRSRFTPRRKRRRCSGNPLSALTSGYSLWMRGLDEAISRPEGSDSSARGSSLQSQRESCGHRNRPLGINTVLSKGKVNMTGYMFLNKLTVVSNSQFQPWVLRVLISWEKKALPQVPFYLS